ncbi:uracil-DNA glycosylase [Leisingera methylohalidivorans]|uniref:Type-4 uracil-DNA glycosylase n=1 Tax=Leisingera methylohalidivorans DSM 14336 TaxID=999552 RepID=V9VQ62_9RHOB|nr:uracil-DNA glycosylase [Leisingera methylohalidivorans]AHC99818.1 uracil-DNA glycosylase [Leisingera methylohalidivorans DSM 14336]
MESALDYWSARALLEWQAELGATEALCDEPIDRYALEQAAPKPKPGAAPAPPPKPKEVDPVDAALKAAKGAASLPALRDALEGFSHCDLKRGARNLVFSDGQAGARVMIIGEAPGRDEDLQGKPFAGRDGQLLDKMLEAIGLSRAESVYLTNVLPWRPPQNRDPLPVEIAMLAPFLERHVALAEPEILVLMGNISCQAVLGKRGITRLRGQWDQAWGKPVMPMFHPGYLLRQPQQKRLAWGDLLELKARLGALS